MENTASPLKWYHYIAAFFSGAFIANFIPHFVNGVSGDPFPSPFSNPPGVGLSSPLVNVVWALLNLLIGYLLFRGSKMNATTKILLIVFFVGFSLMSINLGVHFMGKAKV